MTWDNTLKMRPMYEWMVASMTIQVVEFSREGYKIRKVFWLKINCSQMKLSNLENWSCGEMSKSAKIRHSKSILYVKNQVNLSH